jgi:hypothetical protein
MASGSTQQVGMIWFVVACWIGSIFQQNQLAENLVDKQKSEAHSEVLHQCMLPEWW